MSEFRVIGPLAYMGKEGCRDVRCRRSDFGPDGRCIGFHCSYCDEPCGSQGHGCDAAATILAASRQIVDEESA